MMHRTNRRSLLQQTLAGVGGALLAARSASGADTPSATTASRPASEEPAGAPRFSAYPFGANVWVRLDNRVFTCYRGGVDQKYPYFYPLTGPATGLPMTDETCDPYPHHRSVFFGCDRVNGGNYWQEGNDRGQIVSRGPKLAPSRKSSPAGATGGLSASEVIITDICDWRVPGQSPVIEDRRRYTITAPSRDLRILDADITVSAKVDIHIDKTNHSLFGIRVARELAPVGGGKLINSNGQIGEKATLGLPAKWCGYEGQRLGIVESIVVIDHPNNPWAPDCPWFTRDYGNISPTPFLWIDDKKGWDLPADKSIRLRYRVAVARGGIDKTATDRLWDAFAEA
jgi:hypothetical protein